MQINGWLRKMGHMIEEVALERGHEIVGVIDPTLAGSDLHQPSVISFESEAFRSADVAIEFITPATAKLKPRRSLRLDSTYLP